MAIAPLTDREEQFLLSQHKEDCNQVRKDLEYIQSWLLQQPHLPSELGKLAALITKERGFK